METKDVDSTYFNALSVDVKLIGAETNKKNPEHYS